MPNKCQGRELGEWWVKVQDKWISWADSGAISIYFMVLTMSEGGDGSLAIDVHTWIRSGDDTCVKIFHVFLEHVTGELL